MQTDVLPPIAFVVFGLAFASGLAMFACVFVLARRLGIGFVRSFGQYTFEPGGFERIGRLVFGREAAPDEAAGRLVWGIRAGWAGMLLLIVLFAYMLGGFA